MKGSAVARRYAKALIDLASRDDSVAQTGEALQQAAEAIEKAKSKLEKQLGNQLAKEAEESQQLAKEASKLDGPATAALQEADAEPHEDRNHADHDHQLEDGESARGGAGCARHPHRRHSFSSGVHHL